MPTPSYPFLFLVHALSCFALSIMAVIEEDYGYALGLFGGSLALGALHAAFG